MTTSTDGQICFGILFEDGFEFPWDADPWEGDKEDWWLHVNGYKPLFQLYDEQGEYLNGVRPPEQWISEYYAHRRAFQEEHPFPVKLVNTCAGDYPIYILAVPETCKSANRGYPQELDPATLVVTAQQADALYQFCLKYDIQAPDVGKWWLSSYWG